MRVDGQRQVGGVRVHLDRQRRFGDQVARVDADDAGADDPPAGGVEQQLGQALRPAQGEGAAGSAPREDGLLVGRAVLPRFGFGQAHPGHLRIGVGHGRDDPRLEAALLPRRDLRRDLALVGRLVRQHRSGRQVADREDVRHVGPLLIVDRHEAALIDQDARGLGAEAVAVGTAADRDEHSPEQAGAGLAVVTLHRHHEAVLLRLDPGHAGCRVDVLQALGKPALEGPHQIPVDAGQQLRQQLDDGDPVAQGGVDRRNLQPNDAAADHQKPPVRLEAGVELQRVGRIPDPRVALRQPRDHRRTRTDGDDRLPEGQGAPAGVGVRDLGFVGTDEAAVAAHHLDLAPLRQLGQTASQLRHDAALPGAELPPIDVRRSEVDAVGGERRRLVDHPGGVEQRLGRNAADVQAHAAEIRGRFDQHDLAAQVGGAEGRGVAARSGAQDQDFGVDIPRDGCRRRCRRRDRRRRPGRSPLLHPLRSNVRDSSTPRRRWRRMRMARPLGSVVGMRLVLGIEHDDHIPFRHLVAQRHGNFEHHAAMGRRHLHGRLVALERDQSGVDIDVLARRDEHLDDIDGIEVADVRYDDADRIGHCASVRARPGGCRRAPSTGGS